MKINKLIVENKEIDFEKKVWIASNKNSTGKTTFLRIILYSLGWNIPSTKGINFSKLETKIFLERAQKKYSLIRRKNEVSLFCEGKHIKEFDLKSDQENLIASYMGISSKKIIENLLSIMYFDQEKGWTLLNRGKSIGNNKFNVEQFLEGLVDVGQDNLHQEILEIEKNIKGYKILKSTLEYQDESEEYDINPDKDQRVIDLRAAEAEINLKIKILSKKIKNLNQVLQKNEKFVDMISNFGIYVRDDSGQKIKVSRNNIVGYEKNQELIKVRIDQLLDDKDKLYSQKKRIENQLKNINLFSMDTELERFIKEVRSLNINVNNVESVINSLQDNRKKLKEKEKKLIIRGTEASNLYETILEFAEFLGVENLIQGENFIFTRELKKYSGSILHLLVFAFHMAYLYVLQNKTGECYPLIIDSPFGKEVKEENVKRMYELIDKYFPNNQVITASVYRIDVLTHLDQIICINDGITGNFDIQRL